MSLPYMRLLMAVSMKDLELLVDNRAGCTIRQFRLPDPCNFNRTRELSRS